MSELDRQVAEAAGYHVIGGVLPNDHDYWADQYRNFVEAVYRFHPSTYFDQIIELVQAEKWAFNIYWAGHPNPKVEVFDPHRGFFGADIEGTDICAALCTAYLKAKKDHPPG